MNHPIQCRCGTLQGHVVLPGMAGPVRARLNTQSARGHVRSEPVRTFLVTLGLMKSVIGARLRGQYRRTPFFDPSTGAPVREPQVLGMAERERFTRSP